MTPRAVLLLLITFYTLAAPSAAQARDWVYEAKPGDTLWDLCLEYTARPGCWLELGKYNGIVQDRRILPGTKIRIPLAWLLELPVVGTVLKVQGEVRYQPQDGANPVPLTEGEQLMLGSLITTLDGTARIALGEYGEVFIRPQSILELSDISVESTPDGETRLDLDRGNVEIAVQPKSRSRFEVHTPSAIAAVRGTRYRVVAENRSATRSEVLEGLVAIEASSSVDVPGGFGLRAQQGVALGPPRKLLDPPRFSQASVNAAVPVVLAWAPDPLAHYWTLDLYSDDGQLLANERLEQPRYAIEQLDLGCYSVTVRGVDQDGFNGMESDLPLCIEAPPPPENNYLGAILWAVLTLVLLL